MVNPTHNRIRATSRVPKVSLLRPGKNHDNTQPSAPDPANYQRATTNCSSGFTLIELMVVMAIIAVLASIAIPQFVANVKHAREAVLKEDLHTMRSAIDQFTYDKQKAPQTFEDLVQAGYLKEIPKDPFTQRADTWIPAQEDAYTSIDETQSGGIGDVHSGSQQVSTEGTTYNTW